MRERERERERENVYASESNYLNMEKIVEEAAGAISDPPSTAPPKSFFLSRHPNRTKPTHPPKILFKTSSSKALSDLGFAAAAANYYYYFPSLSSSSS
jgi:hypothetical protein